MRLHVGVVKAEQGKIFIKRRAEGDAKILAIRRNLPSSRVHRCSCEAERSGLKRVDGFEFFANHVALDFVNTVENRLRPEPKEDLIAGFDDLLRWLVAAGVLDEGERSSLKRECVDRNGGCAETLEEARKLREAFRGIFVAVAEEKEPPAKAMDELNRILSLGPIVRRMRVGEDGQTVSEHVRKAETPVMPVVLLAEAGADLLSSGKLDRVRACASGVCGDLFYDTSKSGRRRWCDMQKCGNRAKVGRYRHRHAV
jgi:predicted RNA-binding Zn ribbon-like protein